MIKIIVQRVLMLPIVALAANAVGFLYAWLAQRAYAANSPFGTQTDSGAALPAYARYLQRAAQLDFGTLARGNDSIAQVVWQAAGYSAVLLGVAFVISLIAGVLLGLLAARTYPARVAHWLAAVAAIGNATPSFYLGILGIGAILAVGSTGGQGLLPTQGAGTIAHLILPTLALALRPTTQIARIIAHLLVGELQQPYIATARAYGNSPTRARQRHALPNINAPAIAFVASSARWLVGELIIVEWLFNWPGQGRLLAQTLMQPATTAQPDGMNVFLNPAVLALTFSVLALLFVGINLISTWAAHRLDPRLRSAP